MREPRLLIDQELLDWMQDVRWIYARTMPRHPHHYTLRREQDEELFVNVVYTIWMAGYDRWYLRRKWRSLDVGDHYVWVCTTPGPDMPVPLQDTILINRADRVQERLL